MGRVHEGKCNLLIMGTGPDYDSLIEQIDESDLKNHIKIIGFQDNPSLMAQADAILLGRGGKGCLTLPWRL